MANLVDSWKDNREATVNLSPQVAERGLHDLPKVANTLRYRRNGIAPEMLFRKISGGVRRAGELAQ